MKFFKYSLFIAVVVLLAGCSINLTMSGASIDENLKTVSVQFFNNRAAIINPTLSQNFTEGLKAALKPGGTITLEFPHLLTLLLLNQFDTVYHEHYSYLSLRVVDEIFQRAGLRVYDVEKLPTHGGSLRIYGCHASDSRPDSEQIAEIREEELVNIHVVNGADEKVKYYATNDYERFNRK